MSEKLSALIDNELDKLERERVLQELEHDPDLAEAWSRYHLIGVAMRGDQIEPRTDLSARVSQQLHDEAAPARTEAGTGRRAAGLRSAGNLALAASVAAVILTGGVMLSMQDDNAVEPATAGADERVVFADEATRWKGIDSRTEDELNALLIEHGEFTSASGMNGLTAYTKFVAYDSQ